MILCWQKVVEQVGGEGPGRLSGSSEVKMMKISESDTTRIEDGVTVKRCQSTVASYHWMFRYSFAGWNR